MHDRTTSVFRHGKAHDPLPVEHVKVLILSTLVRFSRMLRSTSSWSHDLDAVRQSLHHSATFIPFDVLADKQSALIQSSHHQSALSVSTTR